MRRSTRRIRVFGRRLVTQWLLLDRFRSEDWSYAPTTESDVCVVMCLWNRPSRLKEILRQLDEQHGVAGVRLHLWNNNRADHELYRSIIREFRPRAALSEVHLVKSPYNMGSISRWFWVRRIDRRGTRPVVIIDDDQNFGSQFVQTAMAEFDPQVVKAWWAWRLGPGGYWDRTTAEVGDPVGHVGPGGSVLSSSVACERAFFTGIPDNFRWLDDVWLSWFAQQRGLKLAKLPVVIDFVMDETNQHHGQADMKRAFYDWLRRSEKRGNA